MVYSNWRQELTEVMTDKEEDKKVTEKKVKNKITINPKLGEAIENMGGELIDIVEMMDPNKDPEEKEKEDPKQKKISQVKKQVLMKKMQAVRQGAGADIVAHYEPEGEQIEEKKGCAHTHKGEECPVHGKKECPDNMKEGKEIPANVKKIAKELDKAVALHKSQAKRLRAAGVSESTEDSLRDRRMERGGVDGNVDYRRPPAAPNLAGKKKPMKGGPSALDIVKAQIRAKHGKGAIMDTKKK